MIGFSPTRNYKIVVSELFRKKRFINTYAVLVYIVDINSPLILYMFFFLLVLVVFLLSVLKHDPTKEGMGS